MNKEQLAVLGAKADRLIVVAGPGSGKTRTLVQAVAKACIEHTEPERIIVVSYTVAASREIEGRLRLYMSAGPALGYCGTLHGFMLKLLRKHGPLVGLQENIGVLAEPEESVIPDLIKELRFKGSIKQVMTLLKREDIVSGGVGSGSASELVAAAYHQRLRENGLLDYDSILHYGLRLVRQLGKENLFPFTHLFVDEAQDSSVIDWLIYEDMPCEKKVWVGDFDQAIYSFRGGSVEQMVCRVTSQLITVLPLQMNYRSGSLICKAADKLIAHNSGRAKKLIVPARDDEGWMIARQFRCPASELTFVASDIATRIDGADKAHEFAVLARTNRLASEFALGLAALGVPVSKKKQRDLPHDWKLARLAVSVLDNPWNEFSMYLYLVAREGKVIADQMRSEATLKMVNLGIMYFGLDLRDGLTAAAVMKCLSMESISRIESAKARLPIGWRFCDLSMLLASQEDTSEEEGHGVYCGTIHSAKGREWSRVFLVGFEDGTIPSCRKGTDLEEERRLAFVGVTRAKDSVTLTCCSERPQYRGQNVPPGPLEPKQPSRFIAEMGLKIG